MALDIIVPSEDIRIINTSGNDIYIEWTSFQPQKTFEVQYKIASTDRYSNWRTCGVITSTQQKYSVMNIYNLVGVDFYEVLFRVVVTYEGNTSLGEVSGREVSNVKSLIFTHGIKNTLKVYDGHGTLEYPIYDTITGTNTTKIQTMDISLNANGTNKAKLPLVNHDFYSSQHIMEDSKFNVLTNEYNYNTYSYRHPAKSYTNYANNYNPGCNVDYGYSYFQVKESYYTPAYSYANSTYYSNSTPYVYKQYRNNYQYYDPIVSIYSSTDIIGAYNYDAGYKTSYAYGLVYFFTPTNVYTYHNQIHQAYAYTYTVTSEIENCYYYNIPQSGGGWDYVNIPSHQYSSYSVLYQTTNYYNTLYRTGLLYSSTGTIPATYYTENYMIQTHYRDISRYYNSRTYVKEIFTIPEVAYGYINTVETRYENTTYAYNYSYKAVYNQSYYIPIENSYLVSKYDGFVSGANTYKNIKNYTGVTYYTGSYSRIGYVYSSTPVAYNRAYNANVSMRYLYYYYSTYYIEEYHYNIYHYYQPTLTFESYALYTEYNEYFNNYIYRQVPLTYIPFYHVIGTYDYVVYNYKGFDSYQVYVYNGSHDNFVYYSWPAGGNRIVCVKYNQPYEYTVYATGTHTLYDSVDSFNAGSSMYSAYYTLIPNGHATFMSLECYTQPDWSFTYLSFRGKAPASYGYNADTVNIIAYGNYSYLAYMNKYTTTYNLNYSLR